MVDYLILHALIVLLLLPIVCIIIGVIRRHKSNGLLFFMFGAGLTASFVISPAPEPLRYILWIAIMWLCYKLFLWIVAYKSRKYSDHASYFIRSVEDSALPSCVDLIISRLMKIINNTPSNKLPADVKRASEIMVYEIALDLVDSSQYRNVIGLLDPTGEQLLRICQGSLERFLEVGYITKEEYNMNNDYLVGCNLNFERYGLY